MPFFNYCLGFFFICLSSLDFSPILILISVQIFSSCLRVYSNFYGPENFIQLILLPTSRHVIQLKLWFVRPVLLPCSNWNATRTATQKFFRLFDLFSTILLTPCYIFLDFLNCPFSITCGHLILKHSTGWVKGSLQSI